MGKLAGVCLTGRIVGDRWCGKWRKTGGGQQPVQNPQVGKTLFGRRKCTNLFLVRMKRIETKKKPMKKVQVVKVDSSGGGTRREFH